MRLRKQYITKNQCYQLPRKMVPKGIMVHSTGANNPRLSRYVQPDDGLLGVNNNGNSFNEYHPGGRKVAVHAIIGKLKDGTVATYQLMPWNWIAWHSGLGANGAAYNMGYIGFEIAEDDLSNSIYFAAVYKEAVELTAYLCRLYNLNPTKDGVVICHSEGHKRGIASNHGDVMHWFPKHGKSMDTFRRDVAKALGGAQTAAKAPASASEACKVKITTDTLNIRTGPGTRYSVSGQIHRGEVYTITATQDGWGRLKSGAGWISLAYTAKV